MSKNFDYIVDKYAVLQIVEVTGWMLSWDIKRLNIIIIILLLRQR
jgi:hypothetical protein